jgi:hypothetical protein
VISTYAHIAPGLDRRASLSHQDRAGLHSLTVAALYSEALSG